MMAKSTTRDFRPAKKASNRKFDDLIRDVPTKVFVQMVSKSGMPNDDAAALCKAFKEMKA